MANEFTPLIGDSKDPNQKELRVSFRRVVPDKSKTTSISTTKLSTIMQEQRKSLRGFDAVEMGASVRHLVQPVDGISPIVNGGIIVTTDGYKTHPRPPSVVKSLPAFVPFRRKDRHRSFYLWWLNQFRHWWKSSRLLVRLAGLFTLAFTGIFLQKMLSITPFFPIPEHVKRRHRHKVFKSFYKAMHKNTYHAVKVVKKLGQGGPMKFFLNYVHPFTRTLRVVVAAWRWIEAAQCRRGEVGTEEAMAFMGNRVSRMLARTVVDFFVAYLIMPLTYRIFRIDFVDENCWHPLTFFIILGVCRAVAPYGASFQGSRVGRVLTRNFFNSAKNRWRPIQSVHYVNLQSDDCCERDEISQTADLAKIGKLVAKAFGKAQEIGVDGLEGQREFLEAEGFYQIGAGSGGYAVYECYRRVWSRDSTDQGELMTILLHVTPYGPSILDVMPRYIVLEFEDSVDRRAKWSEFISKHVFEGPPVVEGYCYSGAFFSPHHFAQLKVTYDKQLLAYDNACKAMCKPRTGRKPNPPADLLSLKAFLGDGKEGKKRRRNKGQYDRLQGGVQNVAKELKRMMALNSNSACTAPRGVILYFEGLDCAGKSSTGGLVEQALRDAGYDVDMRQYNRPPTPEQKLRPWMDRFEIPKTTVAIAVKNGDAEDAAETKKLMKKCVEHGHSALVWDRGPAGDFVYNPEYRKMPMEERKKRYKEFMDFDRQCFEKRILFLKLLFITNRDSIASTLGKRLAQKKMARDLRTWHKASRGGESEFGDVGFEGLDEIELHIDPTDFIAFNSYQKNLRIFTNFALNTDSRDNPWIVVNTGNRYEARKALLRAFRIKLDRFKEQKCCKPSDSITGKEEVSPAITENEMLAREFVKPFPLQLIVAFAGLLIIVFYYCEHTHFGNPFRDTLIRIEDLLPHEEEDDLFYNFTNFTNSSTNLIDYSTFLDYFT